MTEMVYTTIIHTHFLLTLMEVIILMQAPLFIYCRHKNQTLINTVLTRYWAHLTYKCLSLLDSACFF